MGGYDIDKKKPVRVGEMMSVGSQWLLDETAPIFAEREEPLPFPPVKVWELASQDKILLLRYLSCKPVCKALVLHCELSKGTEFAEAFAKATEITGPDEIKDQHQGGWGRKSSKVYCQWSGNTMQYLIESDISLLTLLLYMRQLFSNTDDIDCHSSDGYNTKNLFECVYYLFCVYVAGTIKGRPRTFPMGAQGILHFGQKQPVERPKPEHEQQQDEGDEALPARRGWLPNWL